jgi:hypothetical protein
MGVKKCGPLKLVWRIKLARATRCNNPEDTILHSHRRENLKSYNQIGSFLSDVFDNFHYISIVRGGHHPKWNYINGIFRQAAFPSLSIKMPTVYFVRTVPIGRTYSLLFGIRIQHYLPNNRFRSQIHFVVPFYLKSVPYIEQLYKNLYNACRRVLVAQSV